MWVAGEDGRTAARDLRRRSRLADTEKKEKASRNDGSSWATQGVPTPGRGDNSPRRARPPVRTKVCEHGETRRSGRVCAALTTKTG